MAEEEDDAPLGAEDHRDPDPEAQARSRAEAEAIATRLQADTQNS